MKHRVAWFGLFILLAGCDPADVDLSVTIEVPASAASVSSGTLHVALYRYDPYLMDAPASRVDYVVVPFIHRRGDRTLAHAHVRGNGARGDRFYLGVTGCAQTDAGMMAVLWDGLLVELPSYVRMRERDTPWPCADVLRV